jgi:hypothetical protein
MFFDQKYYKETEGLAMGFPTSGILSGAYVQSMKNLNDTSTKWIF